MIVVYQRVAYIMAGQKNGFETKLVRLHKLHPYPKYGHVHELELLLSRKK